MAVFPDAHSLMSLDVATVRVLIRTQMQTLTANLEPI